MGVGKAGAMRRLPSCAGITRIRFSGRGLTCPPLSPAHRAPAGRYPAILPASSNVAHKDPAPHAASPAAAVITPGRAPGRANARSPRRSAPGGCRTIGHRRSQDTAPAISTRRTSLGSPSARGVRLGVGGSRWQGGVLRAEHCQNGCQAAAHQCRRHPHLQPESYRGRWTAPALPARPP